MTEIPTWWLVLSAVFFGLNILLLIGWIVALTKIVGVVKALQPKISDLTTKVEGIAEKVNDLTTHTRETVENVGGRAKSVVGSVEKIAHTASVQFEKFSPLLVGGLTAIKLLTALRDYKKGNVSAMQAMLTPHEVEEAAEKAVAKKTSKK